MSLLCPVWKWGSWLLNLLFLGNGGGGTVRNECMPVGVLSLLAKLHTDNFLDFCCL